MSLKPNLPGGADTTLQTPHPVGQESWSKRYDLVVTTCAVLFVAFLVQTGCREEQLSVSQLCRQRSWTQRLLTPHYQEHLESLDCEDGAIPLLHKSTDQDAQCALAVVSAGMPRSGSTLVIQLIWEALRQLKLDTYVLVLSRTCCRVNALL